MNHLHVESLDSTNSYVKTHYQSLPHFFVVSANHQTSGRGRYARVWMDNGTQALFSILLKEQIHTSMLEQLPFIVAKAIHQALLPQIPQLLIKWPNDLTNNDLKLGGILVESIYSGNTLDAIIIGIGMNVNTIDFPHELEHIATSMKQITNQESSISEIIVYLVEAIRLEIKQAISFETVIDYCNQYSSLQGKHIQFIKQDNVQLGKVIKILPNGQLQVLVKEQLVSIRSGEVTLIKK